MPDSRRTRGLIVMLAGAVAACGAQPADDQMAEQPPADEQLAEQPVHESMPALAPETEAQLAAAREAVAAFADRAQAEAAGYTQQLTECMASEQGAQGLHFAKPELITDGAQLDALRPEALMYEPQPDGSLRFVGFAYVIPRAAWTAPEPPTFLGQQMTANEALDVWALHVWVADNPNGVFAEWHPNVSCPPA
ncbi:MAG TPA: hypothetical protein VIL18_05015, partial [Longimicrobiales bacterium]